MITKRNLMSLSKSQQNIAAMLAKAGRKVTTIDATNESKPPVVKEINHAGGEVLRCCPFCGGNAESDTAQGFYKSDGSISNAVAIYCTKCDVQMSKLWSEYPELDPDNIIKILRHLWNCRA